jgi:hypothetical protein
MRLLALHRVLGRVASGQVVWPAFGMAENCELKKNARTCGIRTRPNAAVGQYRLWHTRAVKSQVSPQSPARFFTFAVSQVTRVNAVSPSSMQPAPIQLAVVWSTLLATSVGLQAPACLHVLLYGLKPGQQWHSLMQS